MDALSKCEQAAFEIIKAGPLTGMTAKEVVEAQISTEYSTSTMQGHGIKQLKIRGLIVPIGSRAEMNVHGSQRVRRTLWLDAERAVAPSELTPKVNGDSRAELQRELVEHVSDLITTRHALTEYLQKAIAEDGGQSDPSWLARLIVRDWDIKAR